MRRMQVGQKAITYEQIVMRWQETAPHCEPFGGHFLLQFVTASSQIENINIDYNSTRELFESEQLTSYTGDLRDVFSVLNNKRVANYLNSQLNNGVPVTEELILETHRLLMFASIDRHRYEDNGERAGTYKQKDYCVGKHDVGSLPEDVPGDIQALCRLLQEIDNKDALRIASVFQTHFEYIHPFADGNGRVGRWLTNYILVQHGHPPVVYTCNARKQYYAALEAFDMEEEYTPMLEYMRDQTVDSWPALRELMGQL